MKKKLLCLLLALALIMSMVPLTALAEDGDEPINGVPYLDANGNTQTADNVTPITSGGEKGAGWYILKAGTLSLDTITFTGDAHLILENGADVTVNGGILLDGKRTPITIYAQPTEAGDVEGRLTANGSECCASIGSGEKGSCGDITINGGTITAMGNDYFGAGIGTGYNKSSCGNITINGGTVVATGGSYAAGIGSGQNSRCGNIIINGGIVTATGGHASAGIGTGYCGSCSDITITGGTVTATGGFRCSGMGAGERSTCGNIAINGTPTMKAGTDAETAQTVNKYEGQCYISVMYTPSVGPIEPGEHSHLGFLQTGTTPAGKTVEYFRCFCEKLFEDEDCTIEITDLNAWLAKQDGEAPAPITDNEDPASLSGNGNPHTGVSGNDTLGITLMIALSLGLMLYAIKKGRKEY